MTGTLAAPPSRTGAAPTGRRHIGGLDALRALAAGLVLAYHVSVFAAPEKGAAWSDVAGVGWVGVDVFFAISGFILFVPFARGALDGRAPSLARYARHRARRILPAYWFNLLVLAALATPAYLVSVSGWTTLTANATFTARYAQLPLVNGVAWTLFCEVAFYLVLPLLARAFVGLRWLVGLPLVIGASWLYRWLWIGERGGGGDHAPLREMLETFPAVVDQFAVGMAAAAVWVLWERRDRWPRPSTALLVALAGAALTAGSLVLIQVVVGPTRYWAGSGPAAWWPLLTVRTACSAGAALVVLGVCSARFPLRALLESRPLVYLGTVSYGIYLWHLPVAKGIGAEIGFADLPNVRFLVALVVTGTVSVALAAASYHFVERPFLTRTQKARAD